MLRLEIFPLHRSHTEVEDTGDGSQSGHGVESAVVEEGAGVDGSLGQDGHQLGYGQRLEIILKC